MKSEAYIAIIIVLAVIAITFFIAIIALAASRPIEPIISFTHFTAECTTVFVNGDANGLPRIQHTKDVVFSEYRWYVENYYEDKVISRLFSTDPDGTAFTCDHIGNHDNCVITSYADEYSFEIPRSALKKGTDVDCTSLATVTGRKFEKCDVYSFSQGLWIKKAYVESGTNYPVLVETTYAGSWSGNESAAITETYYMSFDPKKPEDESGLKPTDGVKVYDFRNGKGDAGNGKSNTYTKASGMTSMMNYLVRLFLRKPEIDMHVEKDLKDPLFINKELREMLHLPPMGIPSKYLSASPKGKAREIRDIPASFDSREHWAACKSTINTITHQQSCGSCWAMSGSSVLADRYCIATGANTRLSPQYLVDCAPNSNGCSGTLSIIAVWEDIMKIGIPPESCLPFNGYNGICPTRCQDDTPISESMKIYPSSYNIPWGKTDAERVEAIQKEIMTNGPVEAIYLVFTDFSEFFYTTSGIYHRSKDATYKGWSHAIRIIGWGTEDGQDYWIIANSYGTDTPGKGFFRMRRGNNECNVEEQVAAGIFA